MSNLRSLKQRGFKKVTICGECGRQMRPKDQTCSCGASKKQAQTKLREVIRKLGDDFVSANQKNTKQIPPTVILD